MRSEKLIQHRGKTWVFYDWDSYPTTLLHCSLLIQQTSNQFADVNNTILAAETWEEGLLLGNHLFATQNTHPQTSSRLGKRRPFCTSGSVYFRIILRLLKWFSIILLYFRFWLQISIHTLRKNKTFEFSLVLRNPVEDYWWFIIWLFPSILFI